MRAVWNIARVAGYAVLGGVFGFAVPFCALYVVFRDAPYGTAGLALAGFLMYVAPISVLLGICAGLNISVLRNRTYCTDGC